jgi:hypothetical protein
MITRKEFGGSITMNGYQKPMALKFVLPVLCGTLLLAAPAHAKGVCQTPDAQAFVATQVDAARIAQDAREAEQDAQESAKEAEQSRQETMADLYNEGREELDDAHYSEAASKFTNLVKMKGPQTDAALYWLAYAESRQGKRDTALSVIADLKKNYPQSHWRKDAEALEIEVRQNSGRPVDPGTQKDDDLKILALQGLMNNDPAKGMQALEQYLNGSASPKEKKKALFLLVQHGSPQSQDMLEKIARGNSNPELQRDAVQYLGMTGKSSGKQLSEIYNSTSDLEVKRSVIRAYLMSGDREGLLAIAKKETNESLKHEAIRTLGMMGDQADLQNLYQTETSTDTKKELLQALFLSGDSQRLSQLALSEKNPDLRKAAIRNLGLMGAKDPSLQTIYAKETDPEVKEEIINAYFLGGNASALVAIAKSEKDPDLKKAAVSKLSLMNSKEGNEYLMELLK